MENWFISRLGLLKNLAFGQDTVDSELKFDGFEFVVLVQDIVIVT